MTKSKVFRMVFKQSWGTVKIGRKRVTWFVRIDRPKRKRIALD